MTAVLATFRHIAEAAVESVFDEKNPTIRTSKGGNEYVKSQGTLILGNGVTGWYSLVVSRTNVGMPENLTHAQQKLWKAQRAVEAEKAKAAQAEA